MEATSAQRLPLKGGIGMRDLHELPELRDSMSYLYVFPTRVGVNRSQPCSPGLPNRIPHRRGGEPFTVGDLIGLERIPHTRGGEPNYLIPIVPGAEYSPQAWG